MLKFIVDSCIIPVLSPSFMSAKLTFDYFFLYLRYAEQLSAIPQFANLGPLFKSSTPVELTESETEYMVRCIKHTFRDYIVLQVRRLHFLYKRG